MPEPDGPRMEQNEPPAMVAVTDERIWRSSSAPAALAVFLRVRKDRCAGT